MEVQTKLNMIEKSKLKSQKNIAAINKKPNIKGIYKSYHLTKDIDNKKDLIRFKENTNFFTDEENNKISFIYKENNTITGKNPFIYDENKIISLKQGTSKYHSRHMKNNIITREEENNNIIKNKVRRKYPFRNKENTNINRDKINNIIDRIKEKNIIIKDKKNINITRSKEKNIIEKGTENNNIAVIYDENKKITNDEERDKYCLKYKENNIIIKDKENKNINKDKGGNKFFCKLKTNNNKIFDKKIKNISQDKDSFNHLIKRNEGDNNIIKDKEIKKIKRYDEQEFENKFSEIKKKGKVRLEELIELLNHNNLNQDFLDYFFEYLHEHKYRIEDDAQILFPFMSIEICQKNKINKVISEEKRFFELYDKIIKSDISEISKLLEEEYKFPDELKKLNYTKKERQSIYRWGLFGTKIVDFQNIYNSEYFYYILSNYILVNLKDKDIDKSNYIKNLKSLEKPLRKIKFISEEDPEYFEYVILILLNAQKDNEFNCIDGISLYNAFISSLKLELTIKEKKNLLNDDEILKAFKEKKIEAKIKNKNLYLEGKTINGVINNYENYYITKPFIDSLSEEMITLEKEDLIKYLKFEYLKDSQKYFDGLLYKIIEKYANSRLSKESLLMCFNINLDDYPKIKEEICTSKIHKYIRMIPYNSKNDTGRTIKQFAKILIDPSKQKMTKYVKSITDNKTLLNYLQKFINIVDRKYIFEHEHQHLCNVLLFFFYIDKRFEINTPPKHIKNSMICRKENLAKEDKNVKVLKESGEIFETVVYGKIQKFFTLNQLLFIANEKNEELSVEEFRSEYEKCKKSNIETLFKVFQENELILSDLVNNIYSELKLELSLKKNKGKTLDEITRGIMACMNDYFKEDKHKILSLEGWGNLIVTEDIGHYDCHVPDKMKYFKRKNNYANL